MPIFNTIGYQTGFLGYDTVSTPTGSNYGSIGFIGLGGFGMQSNALLQSVGTGNYTFEGFYYYNRWNSAENRYYHDITNSAANINYRTYTAESNIRTNINGAGGSVTVPIRRSRWVHFATSRSGGNVRFLYNGSSITTQAFANSLAPSDTRMAIGNVVSGSGLAWNGYVTNVRFTRAALYTAAFVPSSIPLEAPNTSTIYLLRSETSTTLFTDSSPYAQGTSTLNSVPLSWSDFSPFTLSPVNFSQMDNWFDGFSFFGSTFGQPTGNWNDKLGQLIFTSVNNPTVGSNSINGYPNVSFDATSNQYYATAGTNMNIGSNIFGIFAVVQFRTPTSDGAIITKNGGNAVAGKWGLFRSNAQIQFTVSPTSNTTVSTVYSDTSTDPQIIGAYWDRSNMYLYRNGRLAASNALLNSSNLSNTNSNFIGAHNNAAGNGPLSNMYFDGNIGELVVYFTGVSFSASNRQKMEGAMAWRWGLQTRLPSDHPYRTLRPLPTDIFGYE